MTTAPRLDQTVVDEKRIMIHARLVTRKLKAKLRANGQVAPEDAVGPRAKVVDDQVATEEVNERVAKVVAGQVGKMLAFQIRSSKQYLTI